MTYEFGQGGVGNIGKSSNSATLKKCDLQLLLNELTFLGKGKDRPALLNQTSYIDFCKTEYLINHIKLRGTDPFVIYLPQHRILKVLCIFM